jgi:hypothetical protein
MSGVAWLILILCVGALVAFGFLFKPEKKRKKTYGGTTYEYHPNVPEDEEEPKQT